MVNTWNVCLNIVCLHNPYHEDEIIFDNFISFSIFQFSFYICQHNQSTEWLQHKVAFLCGKSLLFIALIMLPDSGNFDYIVTWWLEM